MGNKAAKQYFMKKRQNGNVFKYLIFSKFIVKIDLKFNSEIKQLLNPLFT